MRALTKITLLLAVTFLCGFASSASSATLVLEDFWNGTDNTGPDVAATWTLEVPDACLSCVVTLSVDFADPTAYDGTYLDSFQWVITNPNTDLTAVSNASGPGTWDTDFGEIVNADGCQATGNDSFTCSVYTGAGAGLLINDGDSLSWTFDVTFESALTAIAGNVRASFDNADNSNFNIFSPGGGTFTTDTPQTTDEPTTTDDPQTTDEPTTTDAPEPAILGLLGAGLLAASRRMRRRKL